jgi:membrane protein YdbS with pleckstrin-like domain
MIEPLRRLLLRFLRVPPDPALPAGGTIRVFRAAPAYFHYHLVIWAFAQAAALTGLIGGTVGLRYVIPNVQNPWIVFALHAAEALTWLAFLVHLPVSLGVLRLDFDLRWYILSDRSLRIREGIITVKEKTMTFANIQQISIRQNPLQRLLRIADVQVRTAGGGSGGSGSTQHGEIGESMHEAFFRGVDNAEEIKRAIQERVRLHRDAGLGDPDEPEPHLPAAAVPGDVEALAAARELLEEMRGLRGGLAGRR